MTNTYRGYEIKAVPGKTIVEAESPRRSFIAKTKEELMQMIDDREDSIDSLRKMGINIGEIK